MEDEGLAVIGAVARKFHTLRKINLHYTKKIPNIRLHNTCASTETGIICTHPRLLVVAHDKNNIQVLMHLYLKIFTVFHSINIESIVGMKKMYYLCITFLELKHKCLCDIL